MTRQIVFTGQMERKDGLWLAFVQEIPVASFGRTDSEARANTADAITGWLNAHAKAGQFDEIVQQYGLQVTEVEEEELRERIPFESRYLVPA